MAGPDASHDVDQAGGFFCSAAVLPVELPRASCTLSGAFRAGSGRRYPLEMADYSLPISREVFHCF